MSYLYKATKAYQEQLLCDAQPGEAGSEFKAGQHRFTGNQVIETLRALWQA